MIKKKIISSSIYLLDYY